MPNKYIYVGSVGTPKGSSGSLSGHGEGVTVLQISTFPQISLNKISTIACDNAGIICTSKDGKYVYSTNESKDFAGLNGSGGGLTAFQTNEDGSLTKLNDAISYGSRTSYITLSEGGQFILVTNHGSHTTVTCHYVKNENDEWVLQRGFDDSSIAVFRRNLDGSIGELCDLHVFDGNGYWCYGGGQSTSHMHCVKERNHLVFGMNRGADKIEVLRIDENGKLQLLNRFQTRFGYAPRHMEFHPHKQIFYVVNENYPCVSVYQYAEDGKVSEIQCIPSLTSEYYDEHPLPNFNKPHADQDERNTSGMGDLSLAMPSDIHITRDGKYIFVSNRRLKGKGSITIYQMQEDGQLVWDNWYELDGGDPRGFQVIDDEYLIVGLCDKDEVQLFHIAYGEKCTLNKKCAINVNSPSSFQIY